MPLFERDDVTLYYEDVGSGFPVLLIAPGGMRSAASFWQGAPWNPIEHLSTDFRVIAMDQRNAGSSTAPIDGTNTWDTYTGDQLALLDHLGVSRFHIAGMCIGGAYIMSLIRTAPERVAAAVVFQTIGLDNNRSAFYEMFDGWAAGLREEHPEADDAALLSFRENMYGGDFVFSVTREDAARCPTPLLILLGNDLYHPASISRELASLAPHATLIEQWKDPEHQQAARETVGTFLAEHTPA